MTDLVSLAIVGTGVTGLLGWALIRLFGRRSEAVTLFALSAVTVAAMTAGTLTVTSAMYLSGHDLLVVMIVLISGAGVSLLTAWTLSRQVAAAKRRALARETARRELIAWVSADLRVPLSSLRRTLDGLADGHPLRSDLDRLAALADDLVEISLS
ncbi:hypothetical protein [Actinocorallia longicatena]|uniref:histidine kinase n=1 Tax=Actinocorallia longicatena TaxID=111803 RepID=A0ABP6QIV1_9ACTN